MKPYVTELRTRRIYHVIRKVLALYLSWQDFRVIHISIQNNHLHLIVEASSRDALRRGMQSFAIRTAKAINRARNLDGEVFEYRYHATQITTPRQARNTLAYVLNNWRRHNLDITRRGISETPYDLYSSAFSFDGWSKRLRMELPAGYAPLPVSPPSTSLLSFAYTQFGRIDPYERPGPIW